MVKSFVIGADVLKKAPYAIYGFKNDNVIITDIALRELEATKNGKGQDAVNARKALEEIDYAIRGDSADIILSKKINLINGGTIAFHVAKEGHDAEDQLINFCFGYSNSVPDEDLVYIGSTLSLLIGMQRRGIQTRMYQEPKPEEYQTYTGRSELDVDEDIINDLYKYKEIDVTDDIWFEENQFLVLRSNIDPKHSALAYYQNGKLVSLEYTKIKPYGVAPMNVGQKFAIEALLMPVEKAPLVILKGPAGTAKTHLALAAGLHRTVNNMEFSKILLSRPNVKFDDDIGYLKGGEAEKIEPLIRPFMDNLELLTRTQSREEKDNIPLPNNYAKDLFDRGIIKAEAMAYMRGRSIANTWIILDEAQNMTPSQAYGIVTRAGIGSKIILCGDPEQCDNQGLNAKNCGLTFISEQMKGSPLCWQVAFSKDECVRSALAKDALLRMEMQQAGNGFVKTKN